MYASSYTCQGAAVGGVPAVPGHAARCRGSLQTRVICKESRVYRRLMKEALFIQNNQHINRDRGSEISDIWNNLVHVTNCCDFAWPSFLFLFSFFLSFLCLVSFFIPPYPSLPYFGSCLLFFSFLSANRLSLAVRPKPTLHAVQGNKFQEQEDPQDRRLESYRTGTFKAHFTPHRDFKPTPPAHY
ncbi:hypothetical protein M513_13558 [Trichuris suis]|uniref:Uncharacterized protein n=1 Tax=Trichuris suis TaxID=68888 RepID=A0A085LKS3_9BILA|nr:hypothetical protein M513_13558 [Trichuris suis]